LDFFEQQEQARRKSRRLVFWYLAAVAFVVASYCATAAAGYALVAAWAGGVRLAAPAQFHAVVAALAGGCVLAVSAYRMGQLSEGGPAIAHLLGARYVEPSRCSPVERRLLNVVEEMAIASGVALPPVYLLEAESAVNALAAGYSPNEAVIVVTEGALQKLSRDELQAVMAHEFSHILNGDMALNVHLAALLAGLSWLGDQGEKLVYRAAWQARDQRREDRGAGALLALAGALVAFTGFPGTYAADAIQARISRQRELLADAASVQFTRNPDGIAGAFDSILALGTGTALRALHYQEFSHMFFAPAVVRWWGFPSHPPIEARIRHAHPRFMREDYRATRHGRRREVAVIDGAGEVVKHVRTLDAAAVLAASVGRPGAQHVDFAARLLARLPSSLSDALRQGPGRSSPCSPSPWKRTRRSAMPRWRCSNPGGVRQAPPRSPSCMS
jgi:Zn-dependent protease with chaperone function